MTKDEKINFIKTQISLADYNRAKFLMRNVDTIGSVRRNWFVDYTTNELMGAANHIIINYERPTYTFDKLDGMLRDKKTARMVKVAVPQWRRAINTWFAVRNAAAIKMMDTNSK